MEVVARVGVHLQRGGEGETAVVRDDDVRVGRVEADIDVHAVARHADPRVIVPLRLGAVAPPVDAGRPGGAVIGGLEVGRSGGGAVEERGVDVAVDVHLDPRI